MIYVVTLNWNRADDTIACVQSLLEMHRSDVAIVICDNASNDDCVRRLRTWLDGVAPGERAEGAQDATLGGFHELTRDDVDRGLRRVCRFTLIHTGGNLGYAGGVNVGLRYALAQEDMDHVWVLNNDTRVSHDALTHLVLRVQEDPTIGICGSTLVYAGARDMLQALAGASYNPRCARSRAIGAFQPVESVPVDPSRVERDLAYVNGAAMFVTRAFLERVGLMDETYFLYSEEHDWAHRGRSSFRLGYAPQSVVYHRQGATIGTNPSGGSDLSLFYLYRSKVLFTKRHYARYLLTAIAAALWDACKFVMKRQPGKAGAVMRGLLDARTMKGYMTGDAA